MEFELKQTWSEGGRGEHAPVWGAGRELVSDAVRYQCDALEQGEAFADWLQPFLPRSRPPPWQSDQKANLQICGFLITILLFLKHGVWQATKAREVVLRKRLSPFTRCSEGSSSLEEAQR